VKINHASIDAMIDMGVVHTLVSQLVARILKLKVAPLQKYDHSVLIAVIGSKLELIGSVTLKLYISGLVVHQTAFVAKRRAIAQASFRCGFSLNTKATVSYKGEKGILSLFEDLITVPMYSLMDGQIAWSFHERRVYLLSQKLT